MATAIDGEREIHEKLQSGPAEGKINDRPNDELFTVTWPLGTQVNDEVAGESYTVGANDDLRGPAIEVPRGAPRGWPWLTALNAAILISAGGYLIYRQRRQRGRGSTSSE